MTMNCPRKTRLLVLAQSLLLLTPMALAQQPAATTPAAPPAAAQVPKAAAQSQTPTKITIITKTVVVPVTVKDRSGNLVPDLRKDEFRIFDDNVEQKITSFAAEAYPISMVVLIDNDLKRQDADEVEPSLRAIVGGMSTSDEAFVCTFDQYFHEGHGFTRDQDKLITELRRKDVSSKSPPSIAPPGGPFGGPTINGAAAPGAPMNDPSLIAIKGQPTKALDDAVYSAAMLLQDRPWQQHRKVILLISDGKNGAKFNTHKYDETRAELLRQGITVYCVAVGSAYFERKFSRLEEYAHDTGGEVFFGTSSETFEDFYSRIAEQARNQYTLSFEPHGERKDDYHTLEVRVRREGLTILTRKGYYEGTFASEAPK
ncbi:MAG TPA: VWA domain-containing protein [Candidatus Acidoferrum sp.]|nr:VWA domain-containing protein [Candidatus Acidoferrum sp.]